MTSLYQDLGNGIYCIETELYRQGLASCYLVVEDKQAAFIDTGTFHTVPHLLNVLNDLGLNTDNVAYVIPTHVHLDHAGGAGELMAHCPNATLVTHPKGAPHMIDPAKLQAGATAVYGEQAFARDYGKLVPIEAARVIAADDNYTIDLNGRTLTLLDTPGHANHHCCIFDTKTKTCFTGDTFGISYREFDTSEQAQDTWIFAPTTPVAFDPDAWHHSLDKLLALAPQAMCLTHYGRVTDIERLANDLRTSIDALRAIALSEEDNIDGRLERIHKQVSEHLIASAQAHGSTLDTNTMRDLLTVDTKLNAQGLEVWLQRRAKAAQRAAAQA